MWCDLPKGRGVAYDATLPHCHWSGGRLETHHFSAAVSPSLSVWMNLIVVNGFWRVLSVMFQEDCILFAHQSHTVAYKSRGCWGQGSRASEMQKQRACDTLGAPAPTDPESASPAQPHRTHNHVLLSDSSGSRETLPDPKSLGVLTFIGWHSLFYESTPQETAVMCLMNMKWRSSLWNLTMLGRPKTVFICINVCNPANGCGRCKLLKWIVEWTGWSARVSVLAVKGTGVCGDRKQKSYIFI
jgi:hypothetical protein